MTEVEEGAGAPVAPASAVRGPDGQTLTIACPTCEGSGWVMECHEAWASERLGCPDCPHPDGPGIGLAWRLWILASGPFVVRDLSRLDNDPQGAVLQECPTRESARFWLRQLERGFCYSDQIDAANAVVIGARLWVAHREAGMLGADEPLRDLVADLERATAALELVELDPC